WSLRSAETIEHALGGHVLLTRFLADGRLVVVSGGEDTRAADIAADVHVYGADGAVQSRFGAREDERFSIVCCALSADGSRLLAGCSDDRARLWTLDGRRLATVRHDNRIQSVAFPTAEPEVAPDGR